MKKTTAIIAVILAFILIFSLSSCRNRELDGTYTVSKVKEDLKLSGTFTSDSIGMDMSYTFVKDKVTIVFNMLGSDITSMGTYVIEKNGEEYTITITLDNATESPESQSISFDGHVLTIGLVALYAQEDTISPEMRPIKFSFDEDEVKMTVEGRILGQVVKTATYKGTYEIDDDEITFDFDDKEAKDWNDSFDFEEDKDVIEIDGLEYESK